MKSKVNITDIAQRSGVSISTVSLVLNNKPGVSQETRTRVLEVAEELGYPLKPASRALKNGRLATVGMVVKTDPDSPPQANPFYSKVMVGIEDACRRIGLNLLFATLPVDENNRPLEVPQMLQQGILDGLLMVGMCVDGGLPTSAGEGDIPVVLVDGYSDAERFDSVVSDNFLAAYRVVEFLIEKGHRQIGLVGSDEQCFPSLQERRNGYLRALKENALPAGAIANLNINKSKGYEETRQLLEAHPELTALFCVNDDVASSALRAAQNMGKRVPEDLSIIGYDDTYLAANTHPALTTMHVDTVAMGRAAVHLLSLRAEDLEAARMTLAVHPWLVERESVKAWRAENRE